MSFVPYLRHSHTMTVHVEVIADNTTDELHPVYTDCYGILKIKFHG
jgi:hypothetical protein